MKTKDANSASSGVDLLGRSSIIRDRRLTILKDLCWYNDKYDQGALPMDIGAYDASHHSGDLGYMAKKGLVERIGRYIGIRIMLGGRPGSYRYKITDEGRKLVSS